MNMRKQWLTLAWVLAAWTSAPAAFAAASIVSVEIGIEASTDMATLPSTNTGAIVLTCGTCRARSYHVTPQTTYFVGSDSVTLAQLTAFISSGGTRGMTIFVVPDESAVTRVVVFGQLSSGKRK
jgi:hypothetical protein